VCRQVLKSLEFGAVGAHVADQVVQAQVDGAILDADAEVVGEAPQEVQHAAHVLFGQP
jgi:hypothetical protein